MTSPASIKSGPAPSYQGKREKIKRIAWSAVYGLTALLWLLFLLDILYWATH